MATPEKDYTVAAEQDYAYYSRYPKGSWSDPVGYPREAEDLTCPHCGAEEIICLDDSTDLGAKAECWMCKRQFTITQNCWKFRKIK